MIRHGKVLSNPGQRSERWPAISVFSMAAEIGRVLLFGQGTLSHDLAPSPCLELQPEHSDPENSPPSLPLCSSTRMFILRDLAALPNIRPSSSWTANSVSWGHEHYRSHFSVDSPRYPLLWRLRNPCACGVFRFHARPVPVQRADLPTGDAHRGRCTGPTRPARCSHVGLVAQKMGIPDEEVLAGPRPISTGTAS